MPIWHLAKAGVTKMGLNHLNTISLWTTNQQENTKGLYAHLGTKSLRIVLFYIIIKNIKTSKN